MTTAVATERESFVLLPLGQRRFALPAGSVSELVGPGRLHKFPHTTAMLEGVLVRRGRIVPVCDLAQVLVGENIPTRRFYLIATLQFGAKKEWIAIPVTGPCELVNAEAHPNAGEFPPYVSSVLTLEGGTVEVFDLKRLAPVPPEPGAGAAGEEARA